MQQSHEYCPHRPKAMTPDLQTNTLSYKSTFNHSLVKQVKTHHFMKKQTKKMLLSLVSFLCFFGSVITGDENPPQLEVLFYSSDEDLVWPPGSVRQDTPDAEWPGHMEQLAKHHPRRKVDAVYKKGFPGPEDFYQNFVSTQRPVVFQSGVDHEVMEQLKSDKWMETGRAALSFIEVANFLSPKKELLSGRGFVGGRKANQWYSRDHLHKNYKDIFPLPKCLKCSYLREILFDTRQVLFDYVFPLPVKQDRYHQLNCLIEGSKEVLLVSREEFPEVESLLEIEDQPYGKVSMLNSFMADYSLYPALKKISKFEVSLLGPGDCLYIPAGWVSQTNVLSRDNSVEIRWKDEAWTPDSDCSKGPKLTLSELRFPGENFIGTDHTRDKSRKLMIRAAYLVEMIIDKHLDIYGFISAIAIDSTLLHNLIEWTHECSARAKELFDVLDMNHDAIINNEDVDALTVDNVKRFLGLVEDRLSDLDDIIIDQRVDYSLTGTKEPTAKEREQQIQDVIAKSKNDMVAQTKDSMVVKVKADIIAELKDGVVAESKDSMVEKSKDEL